jgi:hypothetical protein
MLVEHRDGLNIELAVVAHDTEASVMGAVGETWPEVRWTAVSTFGVAAARNVGARVTSHDLIVFLDTDTRLMPGAFRELMDAFTRYPHLAAAGPRILNPDGTLQFSARSFYTPMSLILRRIPGSRAAASRSVQRHLLLDWDHRDERVVDWIVGACFVVSRAVFERVGEFSEATSFGFEDVEWCYRAKKAGHEVRYIPSAVIEHDYVRSSLGLNRRTLSHAGAALRHPGLIVRAGLVGAIQGLRNRTRSEVM